MTGPDPGDVIEDRSLVTPDGRTVAWTECGLRDGDRVLLRMPGTPGSRFGIRADRTPWIERGLRVLTTERPGFGASTPWPERGHAGPADDVARILDELGINDDVALIGVSGGGPHVLAFCARHPGRVRSATITVGGAPLNPDEFSQVIELNKEASRLARAGDVDGLRALSTKQRDEILADPLAAFRSIMATAPADDQVIMQDPDWQRTHVRNVTEALRQGVDGWVHESLVFENNWSEIDFESIKTSITWWASDGDRNIPLSAVKRLVARLPNVRLNVWSDGGHLTGYRREGEILDDLLARC
jgi:pimeloyl-ACP methyl ester carboxylesterase